MAIGDALAKLGNENVGFVKAGMAIGDLAAIVGSAMVGIVGIAGLAKAVRLTDLRSLRDAVFVLLLVFCVCMGCERGRVRVDGMCESSSKLVLNQSG